MCLAQPTTIRLYRKDHIQWIAAEENKDEDEVKQQQQQQQYQQINHVLLWMKSKSWFDLKFLCGGSFFFCSCRCCLPWPSTCDVMNRSFLGDLVKERKWVHSKSVSCGFSLSVFHSSLLFVLRFMQIYCEISCACFMCAINDELLHKQCLKCKHFTKYKCKTEEKTKRTAKRGNQNY